MRSQRFLLKQSSRRLLQKPLLVRQVMGESMAPTLVPSQLVLGVGWFKKLQVGDVVICRHQNREIIKRVQFVDTNAVYVIGDNYSVSTDSRQFGPLRTEEIIAKVIYPRSLRRL